MMAALPGPGDEDRRQATGPGVALAVAGLTPASCASSPAARARPSSSAVSMVARVRSAISAAAGRDISPVGRCQAGWQAYFDRSRGILRRWSNYERRHSQERRCRGCLMGRAP